MSTRDYSPLAQALIRRAMSLARKDYIEVDNEEALAELEKQIIERAETYDARKGASFETWVLTGFKYAMLKAYGSPGKHPCLSFDESIKLNEKGFAGDGLMCEAVAFAERMADPSAARIRRPVPADKLAQLNALPPELRKIAVALIEHDFDRDAAAAALGVGERQIRRACAQIVELMQTGSLPSQSALELPAGELGKMNPLKPRQPRCQAPTLPAAEQPALF